MNNGEGLFLNVNKNIPHNIINIYTFKDNFEIILIEFGNSNEHLLNKTSNLLKNKILPESFVVQYLKMLCAS